MELSDNVNELKDSIGEILANITPEMCRQVMLSVWRSLQLCVQSGGQYFENLCKVANVYVSMSPCLKRKFATLHRFSSSRIFRPRRHHAVVVFFRKGAFLQKVRLFCELVSPPCLKRKFATWHRFSKHWPPDWTHGCKRRCMLSLTWRHISGVMVTRTSPMLCFSSLISSINSMDNFIASVHLQLNKV